MTISFVLDKLDMGGLQRVNTIIANELSKTHDVSIIVFEKDENFYPLENNIKILSLTNKFSIKFIHSLKAINYIYKKIMGRSSNLVVNIQVYYLIKVLKKEKIDEIVVSGPALLFVRKLKKIMPGLRVNMWMHSSADKYLNIYFKNSLQEFTKSMNNADVIIALTDIDKVAFSKYNHNVVRIYNPLTMNKEMISSDFSNQTILSVGRIDPYTKGLDYLLEVAKMLPNSWTITLIGDGSKQSLEWLKKNIIENNLQDKVIFKGVMFGEQLEEYYSKATMYIMTSRWEGFGLVLLEAMSFSLPIISFKHNGSKEILGNGKYGILIENGNTMSMSVAINELINNKEVLAKYSQKSRERVEKFTIANIILEWEKILSRD